MREVIKIDKKFRIRITDRSNKRHSWGLIVIEHIEEDPDIGRDVELYLFWDEDGGFFKTKDDAMAAVKRMLEIEA